MTQALGLLPLATSLRAHAQTTAVGTRALEELESRHGGRLGVAVLDVESGARLERRPHERFAMCSTFKTIAVARVLARVDARTEDLDRRVSFSREDLVTYSPVTEKRVGAPGMTIAELCEAAITVSDNTAANLLLSTFGGPSALTAYSRSLGDSVTRLDRIETDLNEATPGDPRDTTTPTAMLDTTRRLVLGEALSTASRERLTAWLVATRTGAARLRAGFPKDWRVANKTGTGNHASTNDVAVVWPPGKQPLLVAVYYAESSADAAQREAIVAEVAKLAAAIRTR